MFKEVEIDRDGLLQAIDEHIARESGNQKTLILLLIDITNLYQINHVFGHYEAGDYLLNESYTRLKKMNKNDSCLFRSGRHQFALILPAIVSTSLVVVVLNKLLKNLEEDVVGSFGEVNAHVSIGVAINQPEMSAIETLLLAEDSLEQSKINNVPYQIDIKIVKKEEEYELERHFLEAMSNNAFELFYQPKVSFKTGKTCKAEALLRWQHPERGFIPPEMIVQIAEKTGTLFNLTKWVTHTALRQLEQWTADHKDLSIAVNIPANIVHQRELQDMVKNALSIWGVEPEQLTLEITESAVIEDKKSGYDNLLALKNFGLKLSIDDFGTGYSSMSYFKQIPAHELKIDQSFIFHLIDDKQDQSLVRIMIELAHIFHLEVVAEGIENQETYDFLKKLNCDYAQGYLLSRPLSADKFTQWLADGL